MAGVSSYADLQGGIQTLQGAPDVPAQLQAQVTSAATPDQIQGTEAIGLSGMQSVASGDAMSPDQIRGGFALAASGALALGAGMSLSAAMPIMLPIAAIVFAGGAGIEAVLKHIFGINAANTSQVYACSSNDNTNGTSPTDPKWKRAWHPSLYDGADYHSPPNWHPATSGKFESWARPLLIRALDMSGNCQPVPGAQQVDPGQLQKAIDGGDLSGVGRLADYYTAMWQLGLIKAWNESNPGAPMRTITLDTSIPYGDLRGHDPVQEMLWRFRRVLTRYQSQLAANAPISIQVADPGPNDTKKMTSLLHLGPVAQVMAITPAAPPAQKLLSFGFSGGIKAQAQPDGSVHAVLHPIPVAAWRRYLPFAPAVVGAVLFPFAGIVAPIVGGVVTLIWKGTQS